jgi:hypothetical protein
MAKEKKNLADKIIEFEANISKQLKGIIEFRLK